MKDSIRSRVDESNLTLFTHLQLPQTNAIAFKGIA
jgi:hypothetical protein